MASDTLQAGGPPEGTAVARLHAILAEHGIDPAHPLEVLADAGRLVASPGIGDPFLVDLRHLAFVTIDNPGSRDLDQALHISPGADGGFVVHYALADASYYVTPGTALYAEAMRRGVTYYLPGLAAPMLPRPLSEGIVSLNPGVDRRAFVMRMTLDADARVLDTRFVRARIRSRRKLTYGGVQAFFDGDPALAGEPFAPSLELLRTVGEKRIALADERNVVRYNRIETAATIDPKNPDRFVVKARVRNDTERYNEQISLLCNAEGARFMADAKRSPHITPIFRIHPKPVAARLDDLRRMSERVAEAHGLGPAWVWRTDEPLADYLARLPAQGASARIAAALERQAIMSNRRSVFSVDPGPHHGVGVDPYARFSAPMREMVGIFTHKEALEKLTGVAPSGWPAAARAEQERMVEIANRTKTLQSRVAKAADLLVLDQFLREDLARPERERPTREGTVMGLSRRKVYVQFDDPPFQVKARIRDLAASAGTTFDGDDVQLVAGRPGVPPIRLGDAIRLRVERRVGRRYIFALEA